MAITRFQFFPPERVVEHIITNPFEETLAAEPLDKKKGKIEYILEELPGGRTRLIARSEFVPSTGRLHTRAWIDGTWEQFLSNLQRLSTAPQAAPSRSKR